MKVIVHKGPPGVIEIPKTRRGRCTKRCFRYGKYPTKSRCSYPAPYSVSGVQVCGVHKNAILRNAEIYTEKGFEKPPVTELHKWPEFWEVRTVWKE